jgi:ATP adenylyltransferase
MTYIKKGNPPGCIFCDLARVGPGEETLILSMGRRAFTILNRYPYITGHLMVVPLRHVPGPEHLEPDEWLEMQRLLNESLASLRKVYGPHGFNVGMNLGRAAGAGIDDHVHLHVVPRWNGDTNFVPVLSDTRVIPESLEETYRKLSRSEAGNAEEAGP